MYWARIEHHRKDDSRDKFLNDCRSNRIYFINVVVVAQNSKNAGMGGAVSGAADSSFGGKQRGLDAFLSKCTIILGIIFAVLSLVLGAMINQF